MQLWEKIEAQQIITANAAYQIVGCDLCPFFKEDIEHTRERGKCQEAITAESVREGTYNATRTA